MPVVAVAVLEFTRSGALPAWVLNGATAIRASLVSSFVAVVVLGGAGTLASIGALVFLLFLFFLFFFLFLLGLSLGSDCFLRVVHTLEELGDLLDRHVLVVLGRIDELANVRLRIGLNVDQLLVVLVREMFLELRVEAGNHREDLVKATEKLAGRHVVRLLELATDVVDHHVASVNVSVRRTDLVVESLEDLVELAGRVELSGGKLVTLLLPFPAVFGTRQDALFVETKNLVFVHAVTVGFDGCVESSSDVGDGVLDTSRSVVGEDSNLLRGLRRTEGAVNRNGYLAVRRKVLVFATIPFDKGDGRVDHVVREGVLQIRHG